MKAGWIGLGKMGKPMSQKLLEAGYSLKVYNRTKEKEKDFTKDGVPAANSPRELMESSDIVFLMVSDDQAVTDIFTGENGLLEANVKDRIVVNMSTVSPAISRKMSKLLQQKGNSYLDAPVSGSVKQAEEASLVIIAGGESAIFDRVKPLLETIGAKALLVGNTGAGNEAKLAVNTFLGIITQGLAEVINFSRSKGLRAEDLMEIINNSALGSPFVKIKGNALLEENYHAAFTLSHLTKDLRLARESGFNAPLGNTTLETFGQAEKELGNEDVISIIKQLYPNQ